MVEQPMVVVRGEAYDEVPPEQAVLSVTVSARDRDRDTTLTRLTERAAGLRRVLDDYPEAIDKRETGGVQIYPELKRGGERVSAYTANVSTTVTVTDFAVLGELLLRLGGQPQASVSGPWWQLRPGSTAGTRVRRAAVADALERAREYADAVGARVQRLVEIQDEGTGGMRPTNLSFSRAEVADSGGAAELQIDPQQQSVSASVVVRVVISEPTALG